MSQITEQDAKLPFHETLLEAIKQASTGQLQILTKLIMTTKILQYHDEIFAAWDRRRRELGWWQGDSIPVRASLLAQKQATSEKKPDVETNVVTLDELQLEVKILLAILIEDSKSHSLDSFSQWEKALNKQLLKVSMLISKVLGK